MVLDLVPSMDFSFFFSLSVLTGKSLNRFDYFTGIKTPPLSRHTGLQNMTPEYKEKRTKQGSQK